MKLFALLFLPLALAACASAPPTSDEIQQKVTAFLGEPTVPEAPTVKIVVEPTGLRWTVFRAEVTKDTWNAAGQEQHLTVPADDTILGLEFGSGLFLDTAGNLSFLPLALWDGTLAPQARYRGQVAEDLWQASAQTNHEVQKTDVGYRVWVRGLFGTTETDYDLGKTPIVALQKKAGRADGGAFWETNSFQMLEAVHRFIPVENGVKHVVQHFGDQTVLFAADAQGVKSSDGSFSVVIEGDHLRITLDKRPWLFYRAPGKAFLIDAITGESAQMTASATGATLTSSHGAVSALVQSADQ
jgi:hypothetical protein